MFDRRTIVVGDVHGCLEELKALLDKAKYRPEDRLVFVGDLVDRGPDPVGVVRFARSLGAASVMGNHEEKHVRYERHEAKRKETGKKNPMQPFFGERVEQHDQLVAEGHIEWLSRLPLYIRLGGWLVTHAGFMADKPIDEQDFRQVIRTRWIDEKTGEYVSPEDIHVQPPGTVYWSELWPGPENVIYGHATLDDLPRVECFNGHSWTYGIDTGCAYGGPLTALVFEEGHHVPSVVQAQALKVYFERRQGDED